MLIPYTYLWLPPLPFPCYGNGPTCSEFHQVYWLSLFIPYRAHSWDIPPQLKLMLICAVSQSSSLIINKLFSRGIDTLPKKYWRYCICLWKVGSIILPKMNAFWIFVSFSPVFKRWIPYIIVIIYRYSEIYGNCLCKIVVKQPFINIYIYISELK